MKIFKRLFLFSNLLFDCSFCGCSLLLLKNFRILSYNLKGKFVLQNIRKLSGQRSPEEKSFGLLSFFAVKVFFINYIIVVVVIGKTRVSEFLLVMKHLSTAVYINEKR